MADENQVTAPITPAAPAESSASSTAPAVSISQPSGESTPVTPSLAPTTTEAVSVIETDAASLLAAEPKAEIKSTESANPEQKPEEKVEEKSVEAEKKSEEKKPDEVKAEEKPIEEAAPIAYEPFKLPDAYKENTDAVETVKKFSEVLGKFENSPKTHEEFQKFGQEATDFYINGVNGALTKQQEYYVNRHNKNITDRIEAVRKDPQLGGKNFDKTQSDMIEAVQAYGGSKEQIMGLRKDMQESGMGVSPSLVRLVANMKSALDKYTKEPVSSNITGTKPQPQQRGLIATLYNS